MEERNKVRLCWTYRTLLGRFMSIFVKNRLRSQKEKMENSIRM